jgi:glycine cleavage system H protein
VTAVNKDLDKDPGTINRDPYEGGWMIKVRATNPRELDKLLSLDDYLKKTGH